MLQFGRFGNDALPIGKLARIVACEKLGHQLSSRSQSSISQRAASFFATPEIAKLCGEFHCLAEEDNFEKLDPQAQLAVATEILLFTSSAKAG